MKKLIVFDFCDTLVEIQSADAYVDFVRSKENRFAMNFLEFIRIVFVRLYIVRLLNKVFHGLNLNKRLKLFQLFGMKSSKLKEYASEFSVDTLQKRKIGQVHDAFEEHLRNDNVLVISGGYSIYLNEYFKDYGIKCLGTDIKFYKDYCLGIIDGKDCLNEEKVKRFQKSGKYNNKVDITYSDSITDKPLFEISKRKIVVSNGKPQSWVKKTGYEEIVF